MIEVPTQDIYCRRSASGIIFRMFNFRPSFSFYSMVDAIKSGKNKEIKLYFNFAVTKSKGAFLYEVRKLKRAAKIHKFFTNFDSQIIIKTDAEAKKIKLCSLGNKQDSSLWTWALGWLLSWIVQAKKHRGLAYKP